MSDLVPRPSQYAAPKEGVRGLRESSVCQAGDELPFRDPYLESLGEAW